MLLSDRDLRQAIAEQRLAIDPFEPELIQPASIDLRLDRDLLLWPKIQPDEPYPVVDPACEPKMLPFKIPEGWSFRLEPGQSVLACTVETVTLDHSLAGRFEGKSSIGRLSLATHITAGFIDPGFSGQITLELVNHNPRPILLHPGMLIGQLCVLPMFTPAEHPYGSAAAGSRYNGQRGPTPSRSWRNWRVWPTQEAA
ncbi:dCTP deaminase [Micromonospora sp. NPDC047730]|uniref:dCTP deaminase n=1 Tax=Micromonospora sp. NPDC047730 TaxID=3364253 RepID=UPI0037222CEB